MRSDVIVVKGIGSQDPVQMSLAHDDHVVHAFAPDCSDQPFDKTILPRRGRRDGLVSDAHGAQSTHNDGAINAIPIPDEVAWRLIPREGFGELTCDPFGSRVCCHIDPDQVSPVESDDDEGIEQVKVNGRDNEQVHGSDVWRVVTQEGGPSLTWRSMPLCHVLGYA